MPLSNKQCEYLAVAWQCMETEPKIDYEKFRQLTGLASAHSARELLRVTKKKLREEYGSGSANGGDKNALLTPRKTAQSTPVKKKTPASKTQATPTSKKRARAVDLDQFSPLSSPSWPPLKHALSAEDDNGLHHDDSNPGVLTVRDGNLDSPTPAKKTKPTSQPFVKIELLGNSMSRDPEAAADDELAPFE